MRVLAVCSLLVLFIGLGYSFRITELLEPLNEGRQGIEARQIEAIAFPIGIAIWVIASIIINIFNIISTQPGMDPF